MRRWRRVRRMEFLLLVGILAQILLLAGILAFVFSVVSDRTQLAPVPTPTPDSHTHTYAYADSGPNTAAIN